MQYTIDTVREELHGFIFQMGPEGEYVTRESYLSGDVVAKLDEARRWASLDPRFAENVSSLEGVQPKAVPIEDITIPFGAPWVESSVYISFLRHMFPAFDGFGAELRYVAATATWIFSVSNKYLLGSVENTRTYGTPRMSAVDLIECGLRLRLPVVYDEQPSDSGEGVSRVKNEQETSLAQAKLQEIREKWAAWIPRDAERAKMLAAEYNRRYNRIVPRVYDGSRLTFPGLAISFQGKPLSLRPHQRGGALRIVERGEKDDTVMLSWFPGAGKTAAAVIGVMKRLQMGLTRKAVVVVPNSVLSQWQETFQGLYPGHSDWILTGTDRAFDARNRRRFLNVAALGDARIILLTYEQFRSIPLRPETFKSYLDRELQDLEEALGEFSDESNDPAKRNLERAFKARQKALCDFEAKYAKKWAKVTAASDADVSWESWGVDCLVCDEGHSFKNDVVPTKMDGISGLPRGESQRAFDMRVKLHYVTTPELFPGMAARRGGKGVFLTGTPVTNSLAETWVMMRHLQPRLLRELGLWQFDAWAATFTTQIPSPEMDATGAWKIRTRLKFHNLPELLDALGLCWDRVDPKLVQGTRPSIIGGRMRVIETKGSDDLRAYTLDLADRAELVKRRKVEPSEDNMLKITHDGRCASVFNMSPQKLWPTERMCPTCSGAGTVNAEDHAGDKICSTCLNVGSIPHRTKVDALVETAWELYCHSDAASGCQLVFVDLFTPKAVSSLGDDGSAISELTEEEIFQQRGVYGVIRDKLVAAGMLAAEVAYIHDATDDTERRDLFARANSGALRVLIGSTQKMGLGVNVQRRAFAAHHLTVPWRPDWLDQANKRVDRDGNTMDAVHLVCYPTEGSYDIVLWQMIETKGEFVAAINSGTYAGRSADDIGDLVIDATTAKAVALGDMRVIEKVKIELELSQLQRQFKVWKNENTRSRWEIEALPAQIGEKNRALAELVALKTHRDQNQLAGFISKIRPAMASSSEGPLSWNVVNDRTAADQRVHVLADSLRHKLGSEGLLVGEYRGLSLLLVRDANGIHLAARHGDGAELIVRGVGARGGIGAFAQLEAQLATLETQIHRVGTQRDILVTRHGALQAETPAWTHAERAATLSARYDELCAAVATSGIVDRQTFRFV